MEITPRDGSQKKTAYTITVSHQENKYFLFWLVVFRLLALLTQQALMLGCDSVSEGWWIFRNGLQW